MLSISECLTAELPLVSPYGDLAQRKVDDYWRTNEVNNLKNIANQQAFTVEQFVFSYFSLKFGHYIVLEAKCVGNWKSETHWWAHYPVQCRSKRNQTSKFCSYRPCLLVWEPLLPLISCNARLPTNRGWPNILAQLSTEKQWVGGVCTTLSPQYQ
jgi:hypothetical protein